MKRNNIDFFIKSKPFVEILGSAFKLTTDQEVELHDFFTEFPDRDRSFIWRKNIAVWLKYNQSDWIRRRKEMAKTSANSKEFFILKYGNEHGTTLYNQFATEKKNLLPSTLQHWKSKGYSESDALKKVEEHQSAAGKKRKGNLEGSIRCIKYWINMGFTKKEAYDKVSSLQKRDLDFFIGKYGEPEGFRRYEQSKSKRKETWVTKDKKEHGKKTSPKYYNKNGQEMKSIYGFLEANNINPTRCMFGPPRNQFTQMIPDIGYRRYDLAVFKDETKTKLEIILEYHGPGHINFSDYHYSLENEPITINGKQLLYLGTYGASYKNDLEKKKFIQKNYPDTKYIVMWYDDLKNKRFNIDELLHKRK